MIHTILLCFEENIVEKLFILLMGYLHFQTHSFLRNDRIYFQRRSLINFLL